MDDGLRGAVIIVHGGAGDIPDERVGGKIAGVLEAARLGRLVLEAGGSSLDACEAAVRSMEKDENFNAGYGSVLTECGRVEMEAAVMSGRQLEAGAVTLLDCAPHPITVARAVMERTRHVLLAGSGLTSEAGGKLIGERCAPDALVTEWAKSALRPGYGSVADGRTEIGGTVGAVALDERGELVAATSTGGLSGKMAGRVGDTPQLGAGTYADNEAAAVSATGHGETILRWGVALRMCLAVQAGEPIEAAARRVLDAMTTRLKHTAGLIAVSPDGHVASYHTSRRMAWAYARPNQRITHYGIEQEQHDIHTDTTTPTPTASD